MLDNFFLNNFDQQAATFFLAHRSPWGIKLFTIITFLGDWRFLLFLGLVIALVLFLKKRKKFILPWALIAVGTEAIIFLVKIWFHRPRPLLAVFLENTFSFPSGHSAIALAFYGYLAYILLKLFNTQRLVILISFSLLIAFIGFSRLYLGVHYLSDVLVGYLVGLIVLSLGIYFYRIPNNRRK